MKFWEWGGGWELGSVGVTGCKSHGTFLVVAEAWFLPGMTLLIIFFIIPG